MNNQNALFENEEKFLDLIHYCNLCNSRLYEQVLTGFLTIDSSVYLLKMETELQPFFEEIKRRPVTELMNKKKQKIYDFFLDFQKLFHIKNRFLENYPVDENTTQDEILHFIHQKKKSQNLRNKAFSVSENEKKKKEALLLVATINKNLEALLQEWFSKASFFQKERTYTSDLLFLKKKYYREYSNVKDECAQHRTTFNRNQAFFLIKKIFPLGTSNSIDSFLKKKIKKTYFEGLKKDFSFCTSQNFLTSFWDESVYSPSITLKIFFDRYFHRKGFINRYLKARNEYFQIIQKKICAKVLAKTIKKEDFFAHCEKFFESGYFDILENAGFFDVYLRPLYLNSEGFLLNPEFSGALSCYESFDSSTIIPLIREHFRSSIRISAELAKSDKEGLKNFENALLPKTLYERFLSIIGFAFLDFTVISRERIENLDEQRKREIAYLSTSSSFPEDFSVSTEVFDPSLNRDYYQYSDVILPRVRLFLSAPNQILWCALLERFKLQYHAKGQLKITTFSSFFKKKQLSPPLPLTLLENDFFKALEETRLQRASFFIATMVDWAYSISIEVKEPAFLRLRNQKKVQNLQDVFSMKQRFFSLEPRTKMIDFDTDVKECIKEIFSFFP